MNRRKTVSILTGIAVALAVLLLTAVVAVRIIYPPERVRRMVVRPLEQALDREVRVDDAAVTILPRLGLKLEGVTVANAAGPGFSDRPMVTLDKMTLAVALLPLLRRTIVITEVILRTPDVLLETAADGTTNIEGLGGPRADTALPPALPVPVTMERLRVTDGTVTYRNAAEQTYLRLGEISQRLRVEIEQEPPVARSRGTTTVGEIVTEEREGARGHDSPPLRARHAATAYIRDRRLVLDTVAIDFGESTAGAAGTVAANVSGRSVQARFRAEAMPGSFNAFMKGDLFGEGVVRVRGRVAGPLGTGIDALDIRGEAELVEVTLRPEMLGPAVVLSGDAGIMGDSAHASVRARAGDSRARLRATVRRPMLMLAAREGRTAPPVRFAVESPRIDLGQLLARDKRPKGRPPGPSERPDTIPLLVAPLLPVAATGELSCRQLDYKGASIVNLRGTFTGDTARAVASMTGEYGGGTLETQAATTLSPTGEPVFSHSLRLRGASAGEITGDVLALVPGNSPLVRALRRGGTPVYGVCDVALTLDARGATMPALKRTLTATLDAAVREGRLDEAPMLMQFLEVVEKLTRQDLALTFDTLRARLRVDTGTVLFDSLALDAPTGLWTAHGTASLDGALSLVVANHLPRILSEKVLGLGGKVGEPADGAAEGTLLSDVFGALGAKGVPSDQNGLVSLRFAVGGTASDPTVLFLGFGDGDGGDDGGVEERLREEKESIRRRLEEKARELVPGFPPGR